MNWNHKHMEKKDIEYIKNKMQVLLGAECKMIGRLSTLVKFHFITNDSVFFLHIHSSFRLTRERKILNANLDMFKPKEENRNNPLFNYNEFKWDILGNNSFDEWVQTKGRELRNQKVKNILISNYGDLVITFENNMNLEIFNNTSLVESWCFLENDSDEAIIVRGNYLERETV